MLERCEQPHPVCTFQDDFQEFEMIDDNEEEEEEEEGNELDAPPSPSASPIPSPATEDTQKTRPTTLNLTVPGTQVRAGAGVGAFFCGVSAGGPRGGREVPACNVVGSKVGYVSGEQQLDEWGGAAVVSAVLWVL